jgi:Domain of unknown function (DUF6438)
VSAAMSVGIGCATIHGTPSNEYPAVMADTPDALLQTRRRGCSDRSCRICTVSISLNGTVIYKGRSNLGVRRSSMSPERVDALLTKLNQMDCLDLSEHCCDCPDAPTV